MSKRKEKTNLALYLLAIGIIVLAIITLGQIDLSQSVGEKQEDDITIEKKKMKIAKLEIKQVESKLTKAQFWYKSTWFCSRIILVSALFLLSYSLYWMGWSEMNDLADFTTNFQIVLLLIVSLNFIFFGTVVSWSNSRTVIHGNILKYFFSRIPLLEARAQELRNQVKKHEDRIEHLTANQNA